MPNIHLVQLVARDWRSVDQVTSAFDHVLREQPLITAAWPGPGAGAVMGPSDSGRRAGAPYRLRRVLPDAQTLKLAQTSAVVALRSDDGVARD